MNFTVTATDGSTHARTGFLRLPHGTVETPRFMPVGTNGTVKAVSQTTLERIGFGLILSNAYHLYLRPGTEVMRKAGGLHRFMDWKGNILTDSGGYQLFSLAPFTTVTREGVTFRSHIDGSLHEFTPEGVVDLQATLGSDIMMALDVCTAPDIDYKRALDALEITTDWAARSISHLHRLEAPIAGALFGIIQGNFFKDLRRRSAEEIIALDFPGIAIGGLSVGEPKEVFEEYLSFTAELLPKSKPRYLMGVGTPEYVFAAVENGIDLFDCVFPTRIARNGAAFTACGIIALKKEEHSESFRPIDESCECSVCAHYSRAYLRHLFKTKEILGAMLTTEHNLHFMDRLVQSIGDSIRTNTFIDFKRQFLTRYKQKKEKRI